MKLLLSRSTQILPQGWDVDWLVGRSGFGAKTIWISKLPRSVTHCQAPHTTETTPNSWERNEINSCKWMWLTHNRLAIALDYYITYSQDCKAEACKANSSAHLLHGEDPQNHRVLSYPTDKEGEGETSGTCLRSELEPRCLHPKFRSLSPAPPCQWWNWGRRGGWWGCQRGDRKPGWARMGAASAGDGGLEMYSRGPGDALGVPLAAELHLTAFCWVYHHESLDFPGFPCDQPEAPLPLVVQTVPSTTLGSPLRGLPCSHLPWPRAVPCTTL